MEKEKLKYSRKGCKTRKALDGSYIKCLECGCKYFTGLYCDLCSKCGKRLKTEIGSGEAMKIDIELKTLKDFFEKEDVAESQIMEELKQEAIKWIKERISKCVYACRVGGMICKEHKFWMERFNITEEDLK